MKKNMVEKTFVDPLSFPVFFVPMIFKQIKSL